MITALSLPESADQPPLQPSLILGCPPGHQAFLHKPCPQLVLIPCDWHSLTTQGKDIWSAKLALRRYYLPMATESVIQRIHLFFLRTRSWAGRPLLDLCEPCSQQRQRSLFTAGLQVFEKLIRSERLTRKDAETAS